MASLMPRLDVPSSYKDNKSTLSNTQKETELLRSTTLYVGNLSFYTTEEQIHELFSKSGEVKRIVMGLDRVKKSPCGFCFVEYYTHEDAIDCLKSINGTKLDDRIIRTDIDTGFVEGRQFGRGRNGGQVRDEFRTDYDVGRGGWGHKLAEQKQAEEEKKEREQLYANLDTAPQGAQSTYKPSKAAENSKKRSKRDEEDEEGEEKVDINSRLGPNPNKKQNHMD